MAFGWIFEKKSGASHQAHSRTQAGRYHLRPMPNEDIHVFVKKIDNTRVVREQDPKANASAWKTISVATMFALLVVGLIVPIANSYLAGYTVAEIEKQNNQLAAQVARYSVRESELTSLEALARAAKNQKFIDPTPESMVVLNDTRTGTVALNRNRNRQ